MSTKKIIRTVIYGTLAISSVFLAGTKGFDAAAWGRLDWFQLLTLAVAMNVSLLNAVLAYLDNSSTAPDAPPKQ